MMGHKRSIDGLCECGCGATVRRRFVSGHNRTGTGMDQDLLMELHKLRDKQRYQDNINGRRDKHLAYLKTESHKRKNCARMKAHRISALNTLGNGNPICERCGAKTLGMLEIHHKNGGGYKDYKASSTFNFYKRIIKGERNDLGILCKVCNYAEYAERKFGVLFKIEVDMEDHDMISVRSPVHTNQNEC